MTATAAESTADMTATAAEPTAATESTAAMTAAATTTALGSVHAPRPENCQCDREEDAGVFEQRCHDSLRYRDSTQGCGLLARLSALRLREQVNSVGCISTVAKPMPTPVHDHRRFLFYAVTSRSVPS